MSSPLSDSSVSSPEKINTREIKGRKSINPTEQKNVDSSSLNITYPLLPAKDFEEIETDDEDNDKDKSQQKNESTNSNKSSEEYIFEEHCADPNDDNNGMLFSNVLFWIMFVITLPIIYAALCGKTNEQIRNKADCSAFLNMSQFQNQDKMLWKSLKSGIEGSFNEKPTRPSIFALFSNDKDTLISIMSKIVEITHRCTYSNENPIILTKTDLWTEEFQEDHSKLILKFKDELEKRKIMIINDVDKLPITVIPSLHSFCDIYNPLVDKSIIFLTIHVPQEPPGKPVEYITKYLQDQWNGLESNILDPLITRITDQTFFLKKETTS